MLDHPRTITICDPQHEQLKNGRSLKNNHEHERTLKERAHPLNTSSTSPHSSGERARNAEDARVGSEASSRNARSGGSWRAPSAHPQHEQNRERTSQLDRSRTLKTAHDDPRNALPPKKQKQRVNHSRGERARNAEDARVGSEASSRNARSAAEAGAPHLPSAACADSRTNEPTRSLKNTQDRTRRPKERAPPKKQKQHVPHSSGERDRERGGCAGGVRRTLKRYTSSAHAFWRAPSAIRSMSQLKNERATRSLDRIDPNIDRSRNALTLSTQAERSPLKRRTRS